MAIVIQIPQRFHSALAVTAYLTLSDHSWLEFMWLFPQVGGKALNHHHHHYTSSRGSDSSWSWHTQYVHFIVPGA